MSKSGQAALSLDKNERIPPRARLLAAAGELFYHHGIRAVGVEAIAEAAGTNKMTLYRHFPSKNELVAEYLRQEARKADAYWDQLEAAHPGDPLAQIRLGRSARLAEPDMLADELSLILEGARVTAQSVGADVLGARLVRMSEAVIASHRPA